MTQPIGEEFIRIRPDTSTFRAELQAQIGASIPAVQRQMQAAQTQAAQAARTAQIRPSGLVLPPGVRTVPTVIKEVGDASEKTSRQLKALEDPTRAAAAATTDMSRKVQQAETAVGRYSRGMFAATAASTGFFRAVSFASGAFLIGATVGASIGAAVNEFAEMTRVGAQTVQLIEATGGAANVTAQQVDDLSQSVLRLTGIDDEQVKAAANILLTFRSIRNEVGAGNDIFNQATRAVADISAVFKTDMRGSAVQLGKALQDPIRGVTALRRSGITLTQSQRDLIKRFVETGRILSAQRLILREVQTQVGGTAEAMGRTLPGRLRILRETSVNALGEYVKRVSQSERATRLFTQLSQGLSQAFATLRATVRTVGPPILTVVEALGRAVQAVGGVGPILAGAAAFKLVGVAVRGVSAASAFYQRALAAGVAANAAQAGAANASAGAMTRQAAAANVAAAGLGKQAAAAGASAAASTAATLAATTSAATATRVGTAAATLGVRARAAGAGLGALRIGLAAIGGWTTVVAVGIAGVAIGLLRLRHHFLNATGSANAFRRAFQALDADLARGVDVRNKLQRAQEGISFARGDVGAAQRRLAAAQARLAATTAAPGSQHQLFLTLQIDKAENELAQTHEKLTEAIRRGDIARDTANARARSEPFLIQNRVTQIRKEIDALRQRSFFQLLGGIPIGVRLGGRTRSQQEQLERLDDLLDKLRGKFPRVTNVIETMRDTLERVPTQKELNVIVSMAFRGADTKEILRRLGVFGGSRFQPLPDTELRRTIGLAGETAAPSATEEQRFLAARALVRERFKELRLMRQQAQTAKENLRTAREQVQAAKDQVAAAREGVANAIRSLNDARQALVDARQQFTETIVASHKAIADAINQSKQAVTDAINSAKTNLDSLGQSISSMISDATEELGKSTVSPAILARIRQLRQIVRGGAGGPETQRAQQQINFLLQAKAPTVDTEKLSRGFANLTDDLNRGIITSMPRFNRRLATLLQGVDLSALKKLDPALARRINDYIAGLRRQAREIITGPRRRGGGDQPTFVPIAKVIKEGAQAVAEARRQAAKDNRAAARNVSDAMRNVSDAERDVAKAQDELRNSIDDLKQAQKQALEANTNWVRKNTAIQRKRQEFEAARFAWDRTQAGKTQQPPTKNKNKPGSGGRRDNEAPAGAGATSP